PGYFGVDRGFVLYLSLACVFLYIFLSTIIIFPRSIKEAILSFFVILSPGAFLAIERVNIDLFIFIGAAVISLMIAYANLFILFICLLFCYYLFLLKYYPVALFFTFIIRSYKMAIFSIL